MVLLNKTANIIVWESVKTAFSTAWKMSKYGVYSVPHFPASGLNTEKISQFSPNTVKYGPEKTPYLDTFHTTFILRNVTL